MSQLCRVHEFKPESLYPIQVVGSNQVWSRNPSLGSSIFDRSIHTLYLRVLRVLYSSRARHTKVKWNCNDGMARIARPHWGTKSHVRCKPLSKEFYCKYTKRCCKMITRRVGWLAHAWVADTGVAQRLNEHLNVRLFPNFAKLSPKPISFLKVIHLATQI